MPTVSLRDVPLIAPHCRLRCYPLIGIGSPSVHCRSLVASLFLSTRFRFRCSPVQSLTVCACPVNMSLSTSNRVDLVVVIISSPSPVLSCALVHFVMYTPMSSKHHVTSGTRVLLPLSSLTPRRRPTSRAPSSSQLHDHEATFVAQLHRRPSSRMSGQ